MRKEFRTNARFLAETLRLVLPPRLRGLDARPAPASGVGHLAPPRRNPVGSCRTERYPGAQVFAGLW